MCNTDFIDQLELRLVELGCPPKQRRRLLREVTEHREDLRQAALAEGLSVNEAEARVAARLGNPLELAEHEMVVLWRSSWWSRHCFVSFCLLPVLAAPLVWALFMGGELYLTANLLKYWYGENLHALGNNAAAHPALFNKLASIYYGMDDLAVALTTMLWWWQAGRLGVKFRWLAIACLMTTVLMLIIWTSVSPHSVNLGLGLGWWNLKHHWFKGLIPLLILAIASGWRWRSLCLWRTRVAIKVAF